MPLIPGYAFNCFIAAENLIARFKPEIPLPINQEIPLHIEDPEIEDIVFVPVPQESASFPGGYAALQSDEEVIRVLEESPKWNPGKQGGRAVKSPFRMPVVFHLD